MESKSRLDIVTIDGPAGAGKSTIARLTAKRLDYAVLDTGAMYRAVALGLFSSGIDSNDDSAVEHFLSTLKLDVCVSGATMRVSLDSRDVTDEIRLPDMGAKASAVSKNRGVRRFCSELQRRIGERGRIVAEGRDMGTVVFPDAKWKFFLTATDAARAQRRFLEERNRHIQVEYGQILESIRQRDQQDMSRAIAPLVQATDAIVIDSSDMTIHEVVDVIVGHVRKKR